MIAAPLLVVVAATLLIRAGWSGRRSLGVVGWALGGVALGWLAWGDGAWGIALGTVAGIAVALALVLYAGATAPARTRRAPREAPAIALPRNGGDFGRRVAVFLLVVPVAFVAAQWCAYGVQALARRAGSGEADAIVLTLFLQPMIWSALMIWQMTRPGPVQMIAPAALTAVSGTLLWLAA
ncbi:hypothetical protein [Sphingomonas sp. TZW2008]|uniref:hypothetical protein n=1 Tax=Sphingomonas sp. TZW2008 TaxID=1917973 RepID=UPI000A2727F1|nr:hypothetical protein [Sphingomonas sp. TZW2008]